VLFREICIVYFVVAGTNVPDTCQTAEEQSVSSVESPVEFLSDERIPSKHDIEAATNVTWTAVEKHKLVELVDQLATTVGESRGLVQDIMTEPHPIPTADNELAEQCRREKVSPGDLKQIPRKSTSGKYSEDDLVQPELAQTQYQYPSVVQEQDASPVKSPSCKDLGKHEEAVDLSYSMSSGRIVPKNQDIAPSKIQPCSEPGAVRMNKPLTGILESPTKAPSKIVGGSSEAWTSVDKTLVEDLFDQLLRSFDDVKVSRPEAYRTGSDGSRGPPSANRRSSPSGAADVTNDVVDGGLWHSVAYKWKSHILLRMRIQQVTKRSPCRKRRYADLKLVQNSAFLS